MNKLWVVLHNDRITNSRFGEILHKRASTDPQRLVTNITGYGKSDNDKHLAPALRWGKDNEPIALKYYLEYQQKLGEPMHVI